MDAMRFGLAALCLAVLLTQGECARKASKRNKNQVTTTTDMPVKMGKWKYVNPDDPLYKKKLVSALKERGDLDLEDVDFLVKVQVLVLAGATKYKMLFYTAPKGEDFKRAKCSIDFHYTLLGVAESYPIDDLTCYVTSNHDNKD